MCKEMRLLNRNGINFPAHQPGRYICTAFITQRNNSVDKKHLLLRVFLALQPGSAYLGRLIEAVKQWPFGKPSPSREAHHPPLTTALLTTVTSATCQQSDGRISSLTSQNVNSPELSQAAVPGRRGARAAPAHCRLPTCPNTSRSRPANRQSWLVACLTHLLLNEDNNCNHG